MGVDLAGAGKEVSASYTWRAWWYLFDLACEHGWQPAGTKSPTYDEGGPVFYPNWDGHYSTNDGQEVTKEDAESLAKALESALAGDLACDQALAPATAKAPTDDGSGNAVVVPDWDGYINSDDPEEVIAQKIATVFQSARAGEPVGREVIQHFIDFCRQSQGFYIW